MPTHLLSIIILEWARADDMDDNAIDLFVESKVSRILKDLKIKLSGIPFDEIDTMDLNETIVSEE